MTIEISDPITAVGLAFFLEGVMYAIFPATMKRMVLQILNLPPEQIRLAGLAAMTLGFITVWAVRG